MVRAKISIDAVKLKALISRLSTRINLIWYFRSFVFYFYLETIHILQTKINS